MSLDNIRTSRIFVFDEDVGNLSLLRGVLNRLNYKSITAVSDFAKVEEAVAEKGADRGDQARRLAEPRRLVDENGRRAGWKRADEWPGSKETLADPLGHDLDQDLAGANQFLHVLTIRRIASGRRLDAKRHVASCRFLEAYVVSFRASINNLTHVMFLRCIGKRENLTE